MFMVWNSWMKCPISKWNLVEMFFFYLYNTKDIHEASFNPIVMIKLGLGWSIFQICFLKSFSTWKGTNFKNFDQYLSKNVCSRTMLVFDRNWAANRVCQIGVKSNNLKHNPEILLIKMLETVSQFLRGRIQLLLIVNFIT